MNVTYFLTISKTIAIINTCASSTFCMLASVILVYYIRRRYCLHLEMKEISAENLWYANYQNHLKNLKIKATISNFVLIIILLEIINNCSNAVILIYIMVGANEILEKVIVHIILVSQLCYIPLLCLLLKVVWLAYLHYPYRHTIIRWTAYIILRLFAVYIIYCWQYVKNIITSERPLYFSLFWGMLSLFLIFDLITYLVYSRRFYQHLKSRVLEAKLSADKDNYLANKYLCIHFKVASIIVTASLIIYIIVNITSFVFNDLIYIYQPFERFSNDKWAIFSFLVLLIPGSIGQLIFRIMINLNYLYVTSIILFKYCRQKRNLNKVNDRIRPLVRDYQDTIYSRLYHGYD